MTKEKSNSTHFWRKTLIGVAALVVIYNLMKSNPGYSWVISMAQSNLEIIDQYPDLTIDQKYESKLGFGVQFLNYVKKNTPDTAVILFPKSEDLKGDKNLPHGFNSDTWKSYFIYPRKAVSADSKDYASLKDKNLFTHIAVLNKKGYDLLPMRVDTSKAPQHYLFDLKKELPQ